jgi:hypothetical protein
MKKMSEELEILKTLEEIRSSKYQALSRELLVEIIKIQADFLEHPAVAKEKIKVVVERLLAAKKQGESCSE